MMFLLLLAVITVNIELPDGEIQCVTSVPVIYHPAGRLIVVSGCFDDVFIDGFEVITMANSQDRGAPK